ncbi:MAG: MFS transporter [Candidatus Marinimicrobia bacterium]|nr:MFS transporter [Candidatus Neomarinimicrobiota bacterium]
MKKYLTLFASFIIMLCIGSVYAWSIIASELISKYHFSAFQSQVIFGSIIAIFPATMILVGRLGRKIKFRTIGYISGLLFFAGYFVASHSHGNFYIILLGIGVLAGIATGFGYWLALTSPVQWFPEKKGLITGIAAAGFGLGAIFMSEISNIVLANGKDVLQLLKIVGISYGLIILLLSNFIFQVQKSAENKLDKPIDTRSFLSSATFRKLFFGLFLGTFAGLMIIGSLKIIGEQSNISGHHLVLSISLYAIANFLGRLVWGYASDHIGANISVFLALIFQSISLILLNIITLTDMSYLILVFLIGFGFGGNFVLFAKETAELFGVNNLGLIYPYVFLGYAIAGIAGPMSGGILFDLSGNFSYAISLASLMSLVGSLVFLREYLTQRHKERQSH